MGALKSQAAAHKRKIDDEGSDRSHGDSDEDSADVDAELSSGDDFAADRKGRVARGDVKRAKRFHKQARNWKEQVDHMDDEGRYERRAQRVHACDP